MDTTPNRLVGGKAVPQQQHLQVRRRRRTLEPGYGHIQRAIVENDPKRLTKLLGQRTKLKLTAEDVAVALMEAISQGKVDCVPPLLAARADPNCTDEEGKTPLIVCMESKAGGNPSILRELIKAGSSPNKATYTSQQTALHLAAKKGYQVAVKVLLNSEARVDKTDHHGNTPLMYAAREGHFTALNMLLEYGAEPDPANKQGETPLLLAAKSGHVDCATELLESGADPDVRDHRGQTALMVALKNSHMEIVELLMAHNCDVNVQSGDSGKTILHWAVKNGDLRLVQSLLRLGADPNVRDRDWETPFFTAILSKRTDVLELLMRFRCKINVTDKSFNTGLHLAAREGLANLVPMFLHAGLDCNLKTAAGQTPLMLAASGGHVDIVAYLLKEGANPDAMDRHRATALVYAIMSKASDQAINNIVKMFVRAGCQLDEGVNLVKFVKDNNVDLGKKAINIESRQFSPIEISFLRGRAVAFLMLLKAGSSLKDLGLDTIKHGQDWLSPVRTDFRTVLYLLKYVKTAKKQFPTLKELCRTPALRLFKDHCFKGHIASIKPPQEVIRYLKFTELDDIEATLAKQVKSIGADPSASKTAMANGATPTRPTSSGTPFNRLSQMRATYTLGSTSTNRRRTNTEGSGQSFRVSSESSEEDDVFRSGSSAGSTPVSMLASRTSGTNPHHLMNGRVRSPGSSHSDDYCSTGTERWVDNQNRNIGKPVQVRGCYTPSPNMGRRNVSTSLKNNRSRKANLPRVKSPKVPISIENMLYAPPPDEEPPLSPRYDDYSQNGDLTPVGYYDGGEETSRRPESPTAKDLRDMQHAMMWKTYTTPFDNWDDSESVDDSASNVSVNDSQDSRDTDLSDLSRGSGSTAVTERRPVRTTVDRNDNRTPTRSKIPTFRRPTPKLNTPKNSIKTSHFVEVDDDRPGIFRRTKSCR